MQTVVIALGGNAILRRGQVGTAEEQIENLRACCRQLVRIAAAGAPMALVHGNGPQVGNLLLQQERASGNVPPMPLDVLGAETQGQLGYLIQQTLAAELRAAGIGRQVVTVLTQVVVRADDPAWRRPTKPVGPFLSEREAEALRAGGLPVMEDAGRGWRRAVPSPEPVRIVEAEAIAGLLRAGAVVVACGGGGIPVVEEDGALHGVEAVVDKDLAAQRLGQELRAETMLLLMDGRGVAVGWGTPGQRYLNRLTAAEADRLLRAGEFAEGSMRTKVLAALRFVRSGGHRAVIGSLDRALEAYEGQAGTQVTAG